MFTARLALGAALFVSSMLSAQEQPQGIKPDPLSDLRAICIETIAGAAPLAESVKELAFSTLFGAKRFVVLEKCDKAQAKLKGAVMETAERRTRAESEGIGFGGVAGAVGPSGGVVAGAGGNSGETLASSETRRQATVSLRLVNAEGVVIWAYSQDSTGGKTKGPAADAVDRAIRQLLKDATRTSRE